MRRASAFVGRRRGLTRTASGYLRSAIVDAAGPCLQRQVIDTWAERKKIAIAADYVEAGISGHAAPRQRAGLSAALAGAQPDQL